MRILALTAGAANMYCGTCLRDNALARELLRQGHDVLLLPMYTPTRTDEQNVSHERVFFGGISIYLEQHFPVFRKLPPWMDKLWDSQWMLKLATARSMSVNPEQLGELTLSTLRGEHGFQRKEIEKLTSWLSEQARFDVIALPYTLFIGLAEPLKRALKAPVVCTLQGEDLFLNGLTEPWRSRCLDLIHSQLDQVDCFIAVSAYYATFMAEYLCIPRHKIETVPLGIELEGHAPVEKPLEGPLRIGYFARVCPEKGLHRLCEAVAAMREPYQLRVAGYLPPEQQQWLAGLEAQYGFRYEGSPDREGKIRFLQEIDVLSVPSEYAEPKGLFVLEAMANGTPVVQPRCGAYLEIVNKTHGGILVEPQCASDLTMTLDALASNRAKIRELGRRAADGVRRLYNIERMARKTLDVYRSVARAVHA